LPSPDAPQFTSVGHPEATESPPTPDHPPRRRRFRMARFGAVVMAGLLMSAVLPAAAAASTATSMQSSILTWLNRDRVARGLRPYRLDSRLAAVASDRAATMASTNILSHSVAGSLGSVLSSRGIQWWSEGEDIAWTTYPWGSSAASSLYSLWKGSSPHWALMMSATYNYVGIGVAHNSSTGKTFGSVVFTESADHTRPYARMTGASRSGTTVKWWWRGADRMLQTHTSGLRDFDVEYRVDSGSWRLIRDNTTATSLSLSGRAHGHYYSVRVVDRDRRGNVGLRSTAIRVWVP
jgi:uncharacterized protein YkwD